MHPRLTLILAEQHLADLRRAADHARVARVARVATSTTSSHAAPAPRHAAAKPVSFLHWLRRRLASRTHRSGATSH
jgi:hypothetical protein